MGDETVERKRFQGKKQRTLLRRDAGNGAAAKKANVGSSISQMKYIH